MTSPIFTGYLEDPYLDSPPDYLGGTATDHFGWQVNRVIVDALKANGWQVNRAIDEDKALGYQVNRAIDEDKATGWQANLITDGSHETGWQVNRAIDETKAIGWQTVLVIQDEKPLGWQVARTINEEQATGYEVNRQILDYLDANGYEIRRSKSFPHALCPDLGYLATPYLEDPYLVRGYCVSGPWEVERFIAANPAYGWQVNRIIQDDKAIAWQVQRTIANYPNPLGWQVERIRAFAQGWQVRRVLYNTTNLRVMCDFPSRGAAVTGGGNNLMGNPKGTGQNWSSTSTAAGDFSPFNLNTDIPEQRWQSAGANIATLICDTELAQGTAIDTMAIINHNLTSSVVLTIEGSNDAGFASIGQTILPTWTSGTIWYIAPTFPTQQFRYWRFIISDPTNPDADGLKIGIIVFGTTIILQGECFVDEVRRRQRHFVDKVPTEGFTNVSNDRALKSSVSLDFRNIQYTRGNYKNLKSVFEFARTSLKCLWVPDPQDPPRFGLFAKLVSMPEETHRNLGSGTDADRVDFSLEIDESL